MSRKHAIDDEELGRWAEALRALAEPVLAMDDRERAFADEMGHRRPVDGPFLAWCGRPSSGLGAPAQELSDQPRARTALDVEVWTLLARTRDDRAGARAAFRSLTMGAGGPLTSRDDFLGLEVWTETELGALHALSWLARLGADEGARARAMRCARWHVANTQPDNATGHPWALHVFLWLERESPGCGARLYAETLLQNCQLALGRPDLFSAYVLADSARALGTTRPGWAHLP